ncbi:MAG: hypothetical protein GX096_10175 [Clostridiales bacterium]|nr:hypothetical protein [Clostridiales bacterium]
MQMTALWGSFGLPLIDKPNGRIDMIKAEWYNAYLAGAKHGGERLYKSGCCKETKCDWARRVADELDDCVFCFRITWRIALCRRRYFLDLKGKGNQKLGTSGNIDSNWIYMPSLGFGMSGLIGIVNLMM